MAKTQYSGKIPVTPLGKMMLEDCIRRSEDSIAKLRADIYGIKMDRPPTLENFEAVDQLSVDSWAIMRNLEQNLGPILRTRENIYVAELEQIDNPEMITLGTAFKIIWGDPSDPMYDSDMFMATGLTDCNKTIRAVGTHFQNGKVHPLGAYLLSGKVRVGDLIPKEFNNDRNVPQARIDSIIWGEPLYTKLYQEIGRQE